MSVERYDIPEHISGDTFLGMEITLEINSNPVNLTGATIRMTFSNGQHVFTNGSGITVTSPGTGTFMIDSQIIAWEPGQYKYELWVTLANGMVKKWLMGNWPISNG